MSLIIMLLIAAPTPFWVGDRVNLYDAQCNYLKSVPAKTLPAQPMLQEPGTGCDKFSFEHGGVRYWLSPADYNSPPPDCVVRANPNGGTRIAGSALGNATGGARCIRDQD